MKREVISQKLEELCLSDADRALLRMFVNSSGTPWLGDYLRPHLGRFTASHRLRALVAADNWRRIVPGTLSIAGEILLYADAGVAVLASPLTGVKVTRFVDDYLVMISVCERCRLTWRLWLAAGIGPGEVEKAVTRAGSRGHICEHAVGDRLVADKLTNSLWLMSQSLADADASR